MTTQTTPEQSPERGVGAEASVRARPPTQLHLRLEAQGGATIELLAEEAHRLSTILGIPVRFMLNGVDVGVRPTDDPRLIPAEFLKAYYAGKAWMWL